MRRGKTLAVLLGVLAAACGAAFAVSRIEVQKEQIQTSGETVLQIAAEEVQSLSWTYEGETLSFHKDGTWLYDGDESFPVDEHKINALLEEFESFGAAFVIEDVEDYAQYGLDDPLCTIEIRVASDEAGTESTAQATSEASTESATQEANEASTEEATQEAAEASTEATSKASMESMTQEVGEASTEEATQEANEASTEETMQEAAETSTEEGVRVYEIKLGDYSQMDGQRYVSIGDGKVYLAVQDPLEMYDATLRDMIDNDETPEFGEVSGIVFSGEQSYEITRRENGASYSEDDLYFTERDGKSAPLDTESVEAYLQSLSAMTLEDYVTYDASEEDLAQYGLDNPELTMAIAYTAAEETEEGETEETDASETQTFVLSVSRDPAQREQAEQEKEKAENGESAAGEAASGGGGTEAGAEDAAQETRNDEAENGGLTESADKEAEEILAYVRVGESPIVYQISGDTYERLMEASYNDLRHKEIFYGDFAQITQIDVTLEGEQYTIASEEAEDDKNERVYTYEGEEVDTAALESALSALAATDADDFTEEEPQGKEEISLTLHLDDEDFPQVQITLYRYDGEKCLAEADGAPVAFVPRTQAVELMEAVHGIVLGQE